MILKMVELRHTSMLWIRGVEVDINEAQENYSVVTKHETGGKRRVLDAGRTRNQLKSDARPGLRPKGGYNIISLLQQEGVTKAESSVSACHLLARVMMTLDLRRQTDPFSIIVLVWVRVRVRVWVEKSDNQYFDAAFRTQ